MIWNRLKTWILCATAVLSVGALGISVHSIKEDTELMEVVAESIASDTATVTFETTYYNADITLASLDDVRQFQKVANENNGLYFGGHASDPTTFDDGTVQTVSNGFAEAPSGYGQWRMLLTTNALNGTYLPVETSSFFFNDKNNKEDRALTCNYMGPYLTSFSFTFFKASVFTPLSVSFKLRMSRSLSIPIALNGNGLSQESTFTVDRTYADYSFALQSGAINGEAAPLWLGLTYEDGSIWDVLFSSITLTYTTPELQFAAACSAYRNLGFAYDKNGAGEFTAFRNPRLRFKLNLPSDYSAYIDNENVSVRVRFKNGEAYSEMVLEGSTFMSDGSGGYTCTFSLTNIPPEHFQDEVSFIPIIEGMDLVPQTGTYRTPKCCVITLGASVKSMVDAYLGDLYSSLTEAQQEAITAFAEYYASYLA